MIKFYPIGKRNFRTKETKFYAQIENVNPLTLEDISRNISEVCTVTRHDIVGVLSALQEEIIKALLAGRSVRLGDLGSFRPTLSSSGVLTPSEVNSGLISKVNCVFTSGSLVRNGLDLRNLHFCIAPPHPSPNHGKGPDHL